MQVRHEINEAQSKSDRKQKEIDLDNKRTEALLRERDILNKNVVKTDDKTKKTVELVLLTIRII